MDWIINKILKAVWKKFDGWKSIVSYALLNIPFISGNPVLIKAIEDALAFPSWQTIATAIAHALLTIGLVHKAKKEISKKIAGTI